MVVIIEKVWNPATRTGGFLAAAHRQYPQWQLYGCARKRKVSGKIARMLQFYHGGGMEGIRREDPLEADRIDKTGERTPEGEVPTYEEIRFDRDQSTGRGTADRRPGPVLDQYQKSTAAVHADADESCEKAGNGDRGSQRGNPVYVRCRAESPPVSVK